MPRATVVVLLDVPPIASFTGDAPARRAALAASADAVLANLPGSSYVLRRRFENVAALTLDVDARGLAALAADPGVLRIDLDVGGHAQMEEAAPLARVAEVRSRGFVGLGVKTAVIDSGVQLDHVDLADSIVGQQCFCSSASAGVGCCPNGQDTQSGAGSAADAHGHGTNVAGIITGNGSVAPQGGSPAASVVAIRMLDADGSFYSSSDIVASLDWLASHHPDTRVINMSVGTNALFEGACDNATAWASALAQAVAAVGANGALLTASSGNQASPTSISAPACLSGVMGVGAVWDSSMPAQTFLGCTDTGIVADKPTCFTNSSAQVALYAPGAYTTSAGMGGGTSSWGGTSQAAPLVGACAADLFQMQPSATPAKVKAALLATRAQVTDQKNGLSFPRLDCEASLITLDRVFANAFD
ncbi:MAG: S8 family serine peptidase [Xanthomonadales bacterium]|nr:S8 family serine peptidase [Xanthomonadales bacterium]